MPMCAKTSVDGIRVIRGLKIQRLRTRRAVQSQDAVDDAKAEVHPYFLNKVSLSRWMALINASLAFVIP